MARGPRGRGGGPGSFRGGGRGGGGGGGGGGFGGPRGGGSVLPDSQIPCGAFTLSLIERRASLPSFDTRANILRRYRGGFRGRGRGRGYAPY